MQAIHAGVERGDTRVDEPLLRGEDVATFQPFHVPVRAEAFDEAPATAGTWNGSRFEWIADADSRLGPVLEVMLTSGYYWVPLHRIRRIHVDAPTDLRDVVWMPAQFTWANGGEAIGLIPTRYVGSETSPDARIRLSRMTQWAEPSPGVYMGEGQRLLATDAGEYALMDTRVVELDRGQLRSYPGNYTRYRALKSEQLAAEAQGLVMPVQRRVRENR